MGRPKIPRNYLILEYQLRITTTQLKDKLTSLSTDNNTVSDTITIHDKRNTKSMDNINYTATLNQDNTITLNLNWTDNNTPYKQTLTMAHISRHLKPIPNYRQFYFVFDDIKTRNAYYNEHQFKSDKQFPCRIDKRYISTKKRNMLVIMNPPQYTGKRPRRKFVSTKGYPTKYAKAYMRYQIKLNDYFMEMVDLTTSEEKQQLNKFIKWSEQIKESINKMQ